MVVMVLPAASPAMTEHDRAASPSISTVQAPHSARPQPNLVPVSFSSSRKAQSSGVCGSTSRWRGWPLTFNGIMIALRSGGAHSAAGRPHFHLLDEIFVRQRDWIPASAGIPAPQYQMFGLHVLDQRLRRSVSIAYRILEHPAQVARRQTFPQHRDRRELPVQRARHPYCRLRERPGGCEPGVCRPATACSADGSSGIADAVAPLQFCPTQQDPRLLLCPRLGSNRCRWSQLKPRAKAPKDRKSPFSHVSTIASIFPVRRPIYETSPQPL